MDHQVLLYLVKKPCNMGRIVEWILILLEFDFMVLVKKEITHHQVDHLLRIINAEHFVGIPDYLPDAYFFNVEMVPKWSKDIIPMLIVGSLQLSTLKEAILSSLEQS